MLWIKNDGLHFYYEGEHLQIDAWGPNALRIRSTRMPVMPDEDWALLQPTNTTAPTVTVPLRQQPLPAPDAALPEVPMYAETATINNGCITASLTSFGKLTIHNTVTGQRLLEEYSRNKLDIRDPKTSAIEVKARDFVSLGTGASEYHLTYRLESQSTSEKLYGMGQYQHPYLDLKGLDLELAQRNSQASVPFLLSSLQYGLLWNNPAIGRAILGKNIMSFEARATKKLDFWIVTGSTPKEIMERYADVSGHVPMMPDYGLGFWQCKLRYQTQDELLDVAREYKRRNLPIDVIVCDYFHWPRQGDWTWDPKFWPEPAAMVRELAEMKIKLLVSIWPTVDKRSMNYCEMLERGLLIQIERGLHTSRDFLGQNLQADFTNPETRNYVWSLVRKNYFDIGVKCFWLDEAEPEFNGYDFANYRYHSGTVLSTGNIYPKAYAQAFFEGQTTAGQQVGGTDGILNLVRCAWAGSQRYAALVWSGDIASSWSSFRNQLAAGLSMGIAGIPWWTTDIGGFYGGVSESPEFRELLIRWFQWGAFCPVMRLHGCREPVLQPMDGTDCPSGNVNEVWSFGDSVYTVLVKYMRLRENLRDYTRSLMREATQKGWPVMRTMFFEFPHDERCWDPDVEEQYMYGHKYLCAPVMKPGLKERSVYLPKNVRWAVLDSETSPGTLELGEEYFGGQDIKIQTPIDVMPVFVRLS